MGRTVRLASVVTLVLALFALPVAPVLCDAACPPGTRTSAGAARVRAIGGVGSCHETASAHHRVPRGAPTLTSAPADASTFGAAPLHGCTHPTVASAPTPAAARLLPPIVVAYVPAPVSAPAARLRSARPGPVAVPAATLVGAFSPALRI